MKRWLCAWLKPSVLIQVVLALLVIKYTLETSTLRGIAQKQLGFIQKQELLGSSPRMSVSMDKMYPRDSIKRTIYIDSLQADTGYYEGSKGWVINNDLPKYKNNTVPLFTCRVVNPTNNYSSNRYLWVFNKNDSMFYQCMHNGENLPGPFKICLISEEQPQNRNAMLSTVNKEFGNIAESVDSLCEVKDTSFCILLYQDRWGGSYFSKRKFYLMDHKIINVQSEDHYWPPSGSL